MKFDIKKITHLFYWLFIAKPSGLDKTPKDKRDFKTGVFKWLGYTPKHTRHIIQTVSIKDQLFNTCQWNATTAQKEIDEKEELNVRLLVCKGKRMGLVSGDGFSNLRSGQKVLQEWGQPEKSVITEINNNWNTYSGVNPDLYNDRAEKHKTSSFWSVSSRNDLLKLLDEGKTATTGIEWFTGFNQGGGFCSPWIIERAVGYYVGGHAILIIGYDFNYKGKKVYILQNSCGKEWGDNGKFYITMDYLDANNYGYFTNLDEIDSEIGKFLMEYDGKDVKCVESPTVYHIQAGKKKPYLHEMDYFVWNVDKDKIEFEMVEKEILDKIEEGDNMDIVKSPCWNVLEKLEQPLNIVRVLEAIQLYKSNQK